MREARSRQIGPFARVDATFRSFVSRRDGAALRLLCFGVRPTWAEWIYLVGGLTLTLQYAWIFDDAFVYFRYIDNWLFLRLGLVQNYGEYVEGFSSPLWLLLMSAFRGAHFRYWNIVRLIGSAAFFVQWIMLVHLQRRLYGGQAVVNLPLAYLAFNYGATSFFTSGIETPLTQVAAVAYALYFINPVSRGLTVFIAASPLIRPELAVPVILCAVWRWWGTGRLPRMLILWTLVAVGGWEVFRVWYYADLLPNTFYLKNVLDIHQGVVYVRNTFETYHFYAVSALTLVLLGVLLVRRQPSDDLHVPARGMMVLTAGAVLAYVILIGGAPSHYRFMAFPFALLVCALGGIPDTWLERLEGWPTRPMASALGLFVATSVAIEYPPQLTRHPLVAQTHRIVDKIEDPSDDRSLQLWKLSVGIGRERNYRRAHPTWRYVEVRVDHNCHWNYVYFDQYIIHALGLTDAILARTEMRVDRPAHKMGLTDLAGDMKKLMDDAGVMGSPGMYRRAVEAGTAPGWIVRNLTAIEEIERKMYNHHRLWENLRLALAFPRISP